MIKHRFLNNDTIINQFSSDGKPLLQVETGKIFHNQDGVYDVYPCRFTYEEVEHIEDYEEITAEDLRTMIEEVL